MTVTETHHNVYTKHYHTVFPVKYRKALLTNDVPLAIAGIAQEIATRYDIEFEKIGCDTDHIHCSCHSRQNTAALVWYGYSRALRQNNSSSDFLRSNKSCGAVDF